MKTRTRTLAGAALLSLVPLLGQAQTLRVGLAEDPDMLDPTLARTFVGRIVFSALCDKLVDVDDKLNIVPQLATSYQWSADGKALTMIDYEVRQVQRWPVKNSPLAALLDPDRDLTKYAKVLPTGSNDVLSVEVKDPKRPEYGTITMVFTRDAAAPAGLRLRGWVALDAKNNRTRIDLSNQKFNVAVADSAFRWTDPRPNRRGR